MDIPNGSMRFEQAVPRNNFGANTDNRESQTMMLAEELQSSIGYYVVCDFLIGTQLLETRDGILNSVGINFIVLYQPELDRYIVCDLYALKFITIYNSTDVPARNRNARRA